MSARGAQRCLWTYGLPWISPTTLRTLLTVAVIELRPEPTSPGRARRFVRSLMSAWGVGDQVVDDAELLVTELVTNAVIHARTAVTLEVEAADGTVRFKVSDESPRRVEIKSPSPESATGRGLILLDQIASEWEVTHTAAGKHVSFSLITDQHGSAVG
jgi:anti-sigma regulatory factor (Ser/Thr protein kinase)